MHKNKLTHTDLKPENIILYYDKFKKVPLKTFQDKKSNIRGLSRSSTRSQSRRSNPKMVYKPINDKIKIIDMGGATWEDEYHSTVINTR